MGEAGTATGKTQVMADQPGAERRALLAADRALAQQLRARAPEAGAELYDRFAPSLYRFVLARLLGEVESSEEIVLETLALAARDIARFDPRRASLLTWLLGIARRRVNLELRRRRRRKSVPAWAQQSLETAPEAEGAPDVASAVAGKVEAQRQVAVLAAALSELEMDVLALCYVEDLSVREVGHIIGRSERAVHSILHRARTKARERLTHDDE